MQKVGSLTARAGGLRNGKQLANARERQDAQQAHCPPFFI
jgi:hypothetical protein